MRIHVDANGWSVPLSQRMVIIAEGCGITKEELAMKADMSTATAGHCLEAFKAITEALREAKLLPPKKAPPKAPVAPEPTADAVPAK